MELSLRLDTLGMVEMRYLRTRERYRDWPQFQLLAASRQARVMTYLTRDVVEQLHQQILAVEAAIGLDVDADDDDDDDDEKESNGNGFHAEEGEDKESTKLTERESNAFSPAFAQALKQLNELARQRLPDVGTVSSQSTSELGAETETLGDEEDALEQLQDAFVQMMEVVRELAEELATDALKLTGRFKCARTNIEFVPHPVDDDEDDEEEEEDDEDIEIELEREGIMEIELTLILQLFEEGRSRIDDVPAVELQLDVDDFERLHETLDFALDRDRSSRRRRS
ncbi:MAG: hypothetical protein NVS4B11_27680 [Ktedonobacteraceae bacterium]